MTKAVFFDLNGVLIESEFLSDRFEREYHVSKDKFVPALKEIMEVLRRPDAPDAFHLWEPYLHVWGLKLNEKEFFDFWFSGEKVNQEAVQFCAEFRRKGVLVFILSNNFRERTEYYRAYFSEIFQNVDEAYFSWQTGFVKPSTDALEYILKSYKLKPKDVIYFDDVDANIALAKQLGIQGVKWAGLEHAKKTASYL